MLMPLWTWSPVLRPASKLASSLQIFFLCNFHGFKACFEACLQCLPWGRPFAPASAQNSPNYLKFNFAHRQNRSTILRTNKKHTGMQTKRIRKHRPQSGHTVWGMWMRRSSLHSNRPLRCVTSTDIRHAAKKCNHTGENEIFIEHRATKILFLDQCHLAFRRITIMRWL